MLTASNASRLERRLLYYLHFDRGNINNSFISPLQSLEPRWRLQQSYLLQATSTRLITRCVVRINGSWKRVSHLPFQPFISTFLFQVEIDSWIYRAECVAIAVPANTTEFTPVTVSDTRSPLTKLPVIKSSSLQSVPCYTLSLSITRSHQ